MGEQENTYAPDGYQYGVMHNDGSVTKTWTGRTQRERAYEAATEWAARFSPDHITLARRRPGGEWERVEEGEGMLESMVAGTQCPACGHHGMQLSWRIVAKPLGSFSLSGSQVKVSANKIPVIECPHCGVSAEGNIAR